MYVKNILIQFQLNVESMLNRKRKYFLNAHGKINGFEYKRIPEKERLISTFTAYYAALTEL